jgi:hypothetical protein
MPMTHRTNHSTEQLPPSDLSHVAISYVRAITDEKPKANEVDQLQSGLALIAEFEFQRQEARKVSSHKLRVAKLALAAVNPATKWAGVGRWIVLGQLLEAAYAELARRED